MENQKTTISALSTRVALFLTISLSLMGLISFFIMPREEDPRIGRRNAVLTVVLPGAGPEKIERLVVRPLEDELLKVEELQTIEAEIRLNVVVFTLALRDDIRNLTEAWREVDSAIDRAHPLLPSDVSKPVLDFGVLDVEAIVIALTGSEDRVQLIDAARRLKDTLMRNSDIAEVKLFGAPRLEVRVDVDVERMHALGISIPQLLKGVRDNNSAQPVGFLLRNSNRWLLAQDNDAKTENALGGIKFETGRLQTVSLGEFAKVQRTTSDPPNSLFRWKGRTAVGIGIVPKEGLNIEQFGAKMKTHLDALAKDVEPLALEIVAFQPDRTSERIDDLLMSLVSGMALIAVFLWLTAGHATALIVTLSVPVISLIGLFGYFLASGVLHQISIAAFVISIGQFIDNIVVVVDSIQSKLKAGRSPEEAAQEGSEILRWPMAFATATGICAFLPMLSAQGGTADFVFSLPLVAVITLVASYFVALFFTPIMCMKLARTTAKPVMTLPFATFERVFASLALGPLWRVAALVGLIVASSVIGLIMVKKEFFPESDRNEFLFAVELSPSADIQATESILREIEARLQNDSRVKSMAVFAGGDIPRFYYNLPNPKAAPQTGHALITTSKVADIKPLGLELERTLKAKYPDASFTAQFLQQGPPIPAKIELNVFSEDPARREELTRELAAYLEQDPRVRSVRKDDLKGLRQLHLAGKDAAMADVGLSREDVGRILAFYSSGVPASLYRFDRELLPVVVRDTKGLRQTPESLLNAKVLRGRNRDFFIKDLATLTTRDEIPLLRRENGQNFAHVLADLNPGHTFDRVMTDLRAKVETLPLKPNERVDFGGDAKGAGDANASIMKVVPPAMMLLILFLLIEFRSFRKVMVAALALPVTLMGVFPGLWLGGAPFGFMSLLGILALVGIAINNIILLLEALESEGGLRSAIAARFRAIALTTILTLLGLVPLAFSDSSLWPPLAWTMISGLLTGTIATLIVVPALYRLFFRTASTLALVILAGGIGLAAPQPTAAGERFTVDELLKSVDQTEEHQLSQLAEEEARIAETRSWREAYAPQITAGGEWFVRDRELKLPTPFGEFTQEDRRRLETQLQIRQPLIDMGKMWAGRSAMKTELQAAQEQTRYEQRALKVKFGAQALEILILQREHLYVRESLETLKARTRDVSRLIEKGRLPKTDLLKLEIARERLTHLEAELAIKIANKKRELASALRRSPDFELVAPENLRNLPDWSLNLATGDLEALRLKQEALDNRKRQVLAANLPVVDGFARVVSVDGRNLSDQHWSEAGVGLRWEIFGGAVRQAQAKELIIQRSALARQAALSVRQKEFEFSGTQQGVKEGLRWMEQLLSLSEKTKLNRKQEEQRYFEGRGSLNDLVEADNLFLELKKDRDVTSLRLTIACLKLQLWAGREIIASCR